MGAQCSVMGHNPDPRQPPDGLPRTLEELRDDVDQVDQELARLLQRRATLSRHIGQAKQRAGEAPQPVYVPEREAEVLTRVSDVPGPLDADALAHIYREIFSTSRALQRRLKVAHLGPAATFGHQAALECFGRSVVLQPCATNPDVLTAVESGAADYGLVPFENSTEGPVNEVLDRLGETRLQVCAEITIPVAQALVSRAATLSEVKQVLSHPQALGQTHDWLGAHLPGVPLQPFASTGGAAERAAADASVAAVAPRLAADVFGLNVLAENIQDVTGNATRFLVVTREARTVPTGRDRTLLVFSIRDHVGALRDLTDAFATNAVNLSSIQSRPSKRRTWDYVFFVELAGHASEQRVQRALARAHELTVFLRVLGSWPGADA